MRDALRVWKEWVVLKKGVVSAGEEAIWFYKERKAQCPDPLLLLYSIINFYSSQWYFCCSYVNVLCILF